MYTLALLDVDAGSLPGTQGHHEVFPFQGSVSAPPRFGVGGVSLPAPLWLRDHFLSFDTHIP